jgi:glucokinase
MKSIGIDVGGTKILALLIEDGRIVREVKKATPPVKEKLVTLLKSLVRELSGGNSVPVGLCIAGLVKEGFVHLSPHLPLSGFHIKKELSQEFPNILVENDVNAFVFAELKKGAARGAKNILGVTLGTGIGGGIIIEGKIYRGLSYAGEFGHMTIVAEGPICQCGSRGCWEALSSGWALRREVRERFGLEISVEEVAERARRGEENFLSLFEEMGFYLGVGLANLINIFNPENVVIGGGLLEAQDLYWEKMKLIMKEYALSPSQESVKISPSVLGERASAIGGALLAWEG